ncbi:MAG: hemin uptake protein HemP [Burkholderiales bacterium]|nr:hemin uptake protein HemP [Burkholderiales bacterium]
MTTLKKPAITHRPPTRAAEAGNGSGVSSELLLGEKSELKIRHNGETYSLRKTRLGKLILTK